MFQPPSPRTRWLLSVLCALVAAGLLEYDVAGSLERVLEATLRQAGGFDPNGSEVLHVKLLDYDRGHRYRRAVLEMAVALRGPNAGLDGSFQLRSVSAGYNHGSRLRAMLQDLVERAAMRLGRCGEGCRRAAQFRSPRLAAPAAPSVDVYPKAEEPESAGGEVAAATQGPSTNKPRVERRRHRDGYLLLSLHHTLDDAGSELRILGAPSRDAEYVLWEVTPAQRAASGSGSRHSPRAPPLPVAVRAPSP